MMKACAVHVPSPALVSNVMVTLNWLTFSHLSLRPSSATLSSSISFAAESFEAKRVSLEVAFSSLSNMGVRSIPPIIVTNSNALIFCGLTSTSSSPSPPSSAASSATPKSISSGEGSRPVPDSARISSSVKPPSLYHAEALMSSIDARFFGSVTRMAPSSSLAGLENHDGYVKSPFMILRKRTDMAGSSKGRKPASRTYSTTPHDQMSAAKPLYPLSASTSGAT
mmetsp:Transcript_17473/g.45158  ORF Transcript_17473/g.45158 Transcript_17473/m.45158 type:complete len:224 (-) Transcript_17473:580-1251(-)